MCKESAIKHFGRFLSDWISFWFFTRLCTCHIAIRPHIFLIYIDTRSIVKRTPLSHIQHYFCHKHDAHERICLSIFFTQHYCSFRSFLLFPFFCFKFYFPIVEIIVNYLYLLFLRSRKTNTKCFDKNEKNPQWYHLGVASKVCS